MKRKARGLQASELRTPRPGFARRRSRHHPASKPNPIALESWEETAGNVTAVRRCSGALMVTLRPDVPEIQFLIPETGREDEEAHLIGIGSVIQVIRTDDGVSLRLLSKR